MFQPDGRIQLPKDLREEVRHKFGGNCAYCGVILGKSFHADHVIPWAAGGPDDIMNLFPACRHCNILKNRMDLLQFRKCIEDYHLKSGVIISERFGILKVIAPVNIQFYFEKVGYEFPYDLVKAMMNDTKR